MSGLDKDFLKPPFVHRGLHGEGRPENSLSAVRAAVDAGYGIEIDVQPSSDGVAMVFHDETLERLTRLKGPISGRDAAKLQATKLKGRGVTDTVPTLSEVLRTIGGRVPLVIEIKDQDGALGPKVGTLEMAVVRALDRYTGPVAVMSFNPHSVSMMRDFAHRVPRGLVTCAFDREDWPDVPADRRRDLANMTMLETVGATFISHDAQDLRSRAVQRARAASCSIICWTIRSQEEADDALRVADQITFEGFTPA